MYPSLLPDVICNFPPTFLQDRYCNSSFNLVCSELVVPSKSSDVACRQLSNVYNLFLILLQGLLFLC